MLRSELEKRIRHLETGLDQFSGLDWIVKVGEIAEIKGAVLDMTAETEADCARTITSCGGEAASGFEALDSEILEATHEDGRLAFQKAYGTLRTWLTPAMPGERKAALFTAIDL